VSEIGDEPLQISRKFPEIIVAVDEDRTRGIRTLEKNYPETDVIILDDGFQHRKVKPGLSILLTDFNRLVTRDSLMPFGRLRESRRNRRRADIIIISKSPGYIPEIKRQEITSELKSTRSQKLFFTTVQYGSLRPLFNRPVHPHNILSMPGKEKTGIVLITGIANPLPLYTYLENIFRKIVRLDFPDHHYYRQSDINKIRKSFDELGTPEKIVITTEKDAVRLREITNIEDSLKEVFYYIPVEIGFMENTSYEFDNMIIEYVGKNKRDS
jgi:tetraacyldisaccharide 4'-kinase